MLTGHMFKYEDHYYVVLPGQDSSRDYTKFGLYVSHSPLFAEADTEFKGIVMIGGPSGAWDYTDITTPWIVQFTDGATPKVHLYYSAYGGSWNQTGLAVINNFPQALIGAYPPGNYINTNRGASPSLQIMPPAGWSKSIGGYVEINGQNFLIALDPSVSGRATVLKDTYTDSAYGHLELTKSITGQTRGQISAWIRVDNSNTGGYDLQLWGDTGSRQAVTVRMNSNSHFQYYSNLAFVDTGVGYLTNTWYQVRVAFDTISDTYNFTMLNSVGQNIYVSPTGILFGQTVSNSIDRIRLRTSSAFNGYAFVDEVFLRTLSVPEPVISVGLEAPQDFTAAWSLVTKTLNSTPGSTIRWRVSAKDTSDNWTSSEIYILQTPTAVTISSFTGKVTPNYAQLNWETVNEVGLVGFNIYRSDSLDGVKQKLNTGMLPAMNPGQMIGAAYQFTDKVEQGQHYYYWLELITTDGIEQIEPVVLNTNYWILLPSIFR